MQRKVVRVFNSITIANRCTYMALAILLLGACLRLIYLDSKSVWVDEAVSILLAQKGLTAVWSIYFHPVPPYAGLRLPFFRHDVVHASLLYPWTRLLGSGVFSVRLFSATLSILSIWLTYDLAKALFNFRIALIAALIIAVSPFHVWYAQTARMYTLTAFFALASLVCLWRALQAKGRYYWPGYLIATTLAVYSHLFGLFLVLAENLFVLFLIRRRHGLRLSKWVTIQVIMFILYGPFVAYDTWLLNVFVRSPGGVSTPSLPVFLTILPSDFYAFTLGRLYPDSENLPLILFAGLIYGGLFLIGLYALRSHREQAMLLLLWLFLPAAIALLLSLKVPQVAAARYLIMASPSYYLIVGLGIDRFRNHIVRLGLIAMVALISGAALCNYYTHDDHHGLKAASAYIQTHSQPGDAIIHVQGNSFLPFRYYLQDELHQYELGYPPDQVIIKEEADQGGLRRIWLVSYTLRSTRERVAEQYLGEATTPARSTGASFAHVLTWIDAGLTEDQFAQVDQQTYVSRNPVDLLLYQRR